MTAPRVFRLDQDDPGAALEAAAAALDAGELVLLPTETVYGVAAREDRPEARERMAALKPDRDAPFSRAVPSLEALGERLAPLPAAAARMAARWWPGPVTLVLRERAGGTLGVRIPGHAWTRDLLARVGVPLLLPSANPPGHPAPLDLGAVDPHVLELVSVVIDGGPSALGDASTVVAPGQLAHRVLREGVVSRQDLRQHAGCRVLIVCSGNTCRSPMAARLLGAALSAQTRGDPSWLLPRIDSAGLATAGSRSASSEAVAAMERRGLNLDDHLSRPLDHPQAASADLVLGMTYGHVAALQDMLPSAPPPVIETFDPDGGDVSDPFGGSQAVYEACATQLQSMAGARAAAILDVDR